MEFNYLSLIEAIEKHDISRATNILRECPDDQVSTLFMKHNKQGDTAFLKAVAFGYNKLAEEMLEKAPVDRLQEFLEEKKNRKTALELAQLRMTSYCTSEERPPQEEFIKFLKGKMKKAEEYKGPRFVDIAESYQKLAELLKENHKEDEALTFLNNFPADQLSELVMKKGSDNNSVFMLALMHNRTKIVQHILDKCPAVLVQNIGDHRIITLPLHYKNNEMIQMILEKYSKDKLPDLLLTQDKDSTVLEQIEHSFDAETRKQIFEIIVGNCSPQALERLSMFSGNDGKLFFSHLITCGYSEGVQKILKTCSKDNLPKLLFPENDMPSLQLAILQENTEMTQIILDTYAENKLKDKDNSTALSLAISTNNTKIVQLLINSCPKEELLDLFTAKTGRWHQPALEQAINQRNIEIIKMILQACENNKTILPAILNSEVFSLAISTNNTEIVQTLINSCLKEQLLDLLTTKAGSLYQTALAQATFQGNTEIIKMILQAHWSDKTELTKILNSAMACTVRDYDKKLFKLFLTKVDVSSTIEFANSIKEGYLQNLRLNKDFQGLPGLLRNMFMTDKLNYIINAGMHESDAILVVSTLFNNYPSDTLTQEVILDCGGYEKRKVFLDALNKELPDVAEMILKNIHDENALRKVLTAKRHGVTPLMRAVDKKNTKMVRLILQKCPKGMLPEILIPNEAEGHYFQTVIHRAVQLNSPRPDELQAVLDICPQEVILPILDTILNTRDRKTNTTILEQARSLSGRTCSQMIYDYVDSASPEPVSVAKQENVGDTSANDTALSVTEKGQKTGPKKRKPGMTGKAFLEMMRKRKKVR